MKLTLTRLATGAAVVFAVSCGGGSAENEAAAKAGAEDAPITLTIADSQPVGRPTNLAGEFFAAEVARLSDGAITIEVVPDASDTGPTSDDSIIADVETGAFDLATVPARAWAPNGVDSLAALQAPFEITSNAHMAAIARDDTLVSELFGGLDGAGVHGLALFPESLRMLFSFGDPIVDVDDIQGATFWTFLPDIAPIAETLGGIVVSPPQQELDSGRADGSIDAVETDFVRAHGNDLYPGATVTADLVMYPKFISIVANRDMWDGLTDGQRGILDEAATATREHAIIDLVPVADDAARFCADDEGAVALAGPDAVAGFREAVTPLVAELDQEMLAAIRALVPATVDDVVERCDNRPILDPDDVRPDGGELPNGIYRLEATAEFGEQWNADHASGGAILFSDRDLANLPAVVTWTLADGNYTFEIVFADDHPFTVTGVYQVVGDELLIAYHPEIGSGVNHVRWTLQDDGSLTMEQIDGRDLDWYFGLPWIRIGDAPTNSTP